MLTEELKEQTKFNHQLLEKKLISRMRSMRSVTDYTDMLGIFYSFFGGLEKMIVLHVNQIDFPDYHQRRKSADLAADLIQLGAIKPVLALKSELPLIQGNEQALGALYVIEGSTLGGKIISKMISQQLPLIKGQGLTFFNSYGEETIPMWERFKIILNRPEHLPGEVMINTANETFLKFSNYFD